MKTLLPGFAHAAALWLSLLLGLPAWASLPSASLLFDPDAPIDERRAALAQLAAEARRGEHAAVCLLGRLAFAGPRHPARLPDVELGDAAAWLGRCTLGGDLDAMLVLAELELRDRRPLDAMVWVQSYLKVAGAIDPAIVNSASPYKAGLLARIEKAYFGKRPSNEEVLEYVTGFLDKHGERIAEAYRNGGWNADLPLPQQPPLQRQDSSPVLIGRFARDTTAAKDALALATYLIEVAPDGKPSRVLLMEAYPDAKAARSLRSVAVASRFNAIESAAPRFTYMKAFIDNKAYDLMPHAAPKTRPSGS